MNFILISSAILLSKMRKLFFNLSASPNINNSSIDYSEKYVRVCTRSMYSANRILTNILSVRGFTLPE